MIARFHKHILRFQFEAGTSRAVLTEKPGYFIQIFDQQELLGIGEAAILPGLSIETMDELETALLKSTENFNLDQKINPADWSEIPSMRFAWEMALQDVESGGKQRLFPSEFTEGRQDIPINGLIWMADRDLMQSRIDAKLSEGFSCIKLKVGAIDFEDELALVKMLRERHPAAELSIRLDANGAWKYREALEKMKRLSEFGIHSIEQPIAAGQYELMMNLCEQMIIPVALDEELIGILDPTEKSRLLQMVRPQYIILKPSLLGGWQASEEWCEAARQLGIGWWATSALESNVGLNAIAQWAYIMKPNFVHGLGTGNLYHNNIPSPLSVQQQALHFDPEKSFQFEAIGS